MKEDSKLKKLVGEETSLALRMCDEVASLVSANGGLVRTDNAKDKSKDTIYGIVFSEFDNRNVEFRVLAVAVIDNDLCVLPEFSDNITIDGMPDEDVLADDFWEPVWGGSVLAPPTLTSICESIEQYI